VGEGRKGPGAVEAIVGIGHQLGLGVTAEGVETSAQARRFRDIGCDTIQGFYVARPLPRGRVGEYLRKLGPVAAEASRQPTP
jgi:EAL domain-containing protein (putative c-di-GMP-specific phosphodiesterase class I)